MSSYEQPRTPSPAPAQETEVANAVETSATTVSSGTLSGHMSSPIRRPGFTAHNRKAIEELARVDASPAFVEDHLKACPASLVKAIEERSDVQKWIAYIIKVRTKEASLYEPVADLLSTISKEVFEYLQRTPNRDKLHLPAEPIVFLDHHRYAPKHFPVGKVEDKPDIIGATGRDGVYKKARDGSYEGVPYHCIETIVEAKAIYGDGQAQATRYAFNIQQARPDRPGFYCLSVGPGSFQVVYSSPIGINASEHKPWSDCRTLCAYIYSLYDPPAGHILYDRTIVPKEPAGVPLGKPSWTIQTADGPCTDASIIFLGDPWSRRTTVFRAVLKGRTVIIKESYFDCGRRYEEGELLTLAHAEGFLPGVVRYVVFEDVKNGDEPIVLKRKNGTLTRKKRRVVLADTGEDLTLAKSVNDLLMAVYDMLEVHRTLARRRQILHRDMSLFNVLMYPVWAPHPGGRYFKDAPALIDDVLQGELRPIEKREARCLLIDLDNAALLKNSKADKIPKELQCRTGTPAYIARCVASGTLYSSSTNFFWEAKMPELTGRAKDLYVSLYGNDRYERYKDGPGTFHGGVVPQEMRDETAERADQLPFYHRWEYDAESVFWTMYAALLRVVPQASPQESPTSQTHLNQIWKVLYEHDIPDKEVTKFEDSRNPMLTLHRSVLASTWLPAMQDVAKLVYDIAKHVSPAYAVMTPPPPHDDHLHEAMQRLILRYLVDHRDNPIPLIPGRLRPVASGDNPIVNRGTYGHSKHVENASKRVSKRRRDVSDGAQSTRRITREASSGGGSALKIVEETEP
ncbi:hypothetical protein PYCCODRAFT_1427583 [Trametes coccinea BRFM310]|uniref:Fungal-type protein kinase domain-containing protein n=1 Tax=Trametes coccinea (strain BRFM310) TaxID=1353009 RepID=A0A1Y2ICB2_TRAC3|nr:hypothetical protein PYCCODRAFT_1427583 [Trametes coccinea BRFM310]